MSDTSPLTFPSTQQLDDLRLQVLSLQLEVRSLREALQEVNRMAIDSMVEIRAAKLAADTISKQNPYSMPMPELSDTPEDYSEIRAEKVVDSLFSSIDAAFGKPRGM